MDVTVSKVSDLGGDVLEVVGVVDGVDVVALGWVSAMTNHYDDDTRDADGNRSPKAQPREMTDAERMAYWSSLLTDTAAPAQVAEPTVLYDAGPTDERTDDHAG